MSKQKFGQRFTSVDEFARAIREQRVIGPIERVHGAPKKRTTSQDAARKSRQSRAT